MEGQVSRSSSDGGGGVDETAIGHVDEEVKVGEEVSTNDGSGDVGHDEVLLVFIASKGWFQGFVAVCQDP